MADTERVQPSSASTEQKPLRRFGTFGGVFTPDVLTILGVIMYLRLGWVVGNAGFLGAAAIILLAKTVTICTGLSMASITTNIRIGAGGVYSIITKSLGIEAGGSVGIPFYISQTLSAALYILGFTEGWLRIFPGHSRILVLVGSWLVLVTVSYISASVAIKIQYFILAVVTLSILSFVLTPAKPNPQFILIGSFEDTGFWQVFAIFFPAVTGIMAGANMSGELAHPRRAIPVGTLSAIGVTLVIYLLLAFFCARYIPAGDLRTNQMVMVDNARWAPLVLMGILAATYSSALGCMVGAPRVLQALAEKKTVPVHRYFALRASNGEPRNAIIFTGAIILVTILAGNLNALATFITMFFLITYGTLNLVVFIQQSMKMISFRPTFRVPRFVPLFGALSCIFIMFLINSVFSIIAFLTIFALYVWLTKRGLDPDSEGDVRGGMFLVMAERMSRISAKFPRHQVSWKPDLLVPIDNPDVWSGSLLFIRSITHPSGSIFAFTVTDDKTDETEQALTNLLKPLSDQGILVSSSVLDDRDFVHGARIVIQTLKSGAFRPNTLFLTMSSESRKDSTLKTLVAEARRYELGMIMLYQMPRVAFGMQKDVNIWIRDKSPNWHLAMLIALQIQRNWGGHLNLITVTDSKHDAGRLTAFLESLGDQVRLPSTAELHVLPGPFRDALEAAPHADINIFGLAVELSMDFLRSLAKDAKTSCLFVADSGQENALV